METFSNAMLLVLPLVAVTLIWTGIQALRAQRQRTNSADQVT